MTALKVWSTSEREVTVRLVDLGVAARLDFGDGTETVAVNPATGFVRHTYDQAGAYTLTLKDGTQTLAAERIFARSGEAPAITWAAGADNPNFIDFTWDEIPADLVSTYDVIWGDGSQHGTVTAPAGHVAAHGYAAGDYTVKVYDRQARRWGRYDITVHDKVYDPNLTVAQGEGRYEAVATIAAIAAPGSEVKVWWGDGTDPTVVANAQVGDQVRHTYDFDDTYLVQVGYADGTGEGGSVFVDIPWPAKGTKPASRIEWSPEAAKALGVRAKWHGSGWHYTLHWGDGTQERVRWQDPPTPHVYDQPGTYTVTAVSDLHAEWAVSAPVTVRASIAPQASFTLVETGSNRVRAMLGAVAEPVQYQIGWGDHTASEHGANDLEPIHEYAWNTPAPSIVVRDVPAKRIGHFTGPSIGPAPVPEAPVDGFFLEYVSSTSSSRRFRLRGGGFTPGTTMTWYPHQMSWYRQLVADERGEVTDTIDIAVPDTNYPEVYDNRWLSFMVSVNEPHQQLWFVPVHPRRHAAGKADLTYQINIDDDPMLLEFSVTPAMLGEHRIDWGDGSSETVNVETLPLRARHRFAAASANPVRITLPDGRVVQDVPQGHRLCPPCFNPTYPGSCSVCWYITGGGCGACGSEGVNAYAPVIISNGYHSVAQVHRPTGDSGWHVCYGYGGFPAGTYTFTYTTTFAAAAEHPVNITKSTRQRLLDRPQAYEFVSDDEDITAWFGNVTEWDGGYSGEFSVANFSEEATAWQVDFIVDAPGVVREVWPGTVELSQTSETGWRLRSTQLLESHATTVVGVRVEPAGAPEKFPHDITAVPLE